MTMPRKCPAERHEDNTGTSRKKPEDAQRPHGYPDFLKREPDVAVRADRAYVRWHTDSPLGPGCNRGSNVVNRVRYGIWPLNLSPHHSKGPFMNSIIYIVGLVVVVIAVLSFFGMR